MTVWLYVRPSPTAVPLVVLLMPFLPGVFMSDGLKSVAILAGIETLLLGVLLPTVDGLLVRTGTVITEKRNGSKE